MNCRIKCPNLPKYKDFSKKKNRDKLEFFRGEVEPCTERES